MSPRHAGATSPPRGTPDLSAGARRPPPARADRSRRHTAGSTAPPGARAGHERDAGSLAIELAVVAPALFAVIGLLFSYGRYAQVSGLLETASRDGARAATQARTLSDAAERVDEITADTLQRAPGSCQDSAVGEIVGGTFEPGMNVTVEVRCTVSFSDLGAWGVPGDVTVVRRFASPLDPYRGVR